MGGENLQQGYLVAKPIPGAFVGILAGHMCVSGLALQLVGHDGENLGVGLNIDVPLFVLPLYRAAVPVGAGFAASFVYGVEVGDVLALLGKAVQCRVDVPCGFCAAVAAHVAVHVLHHFFVFYVAVEVSRERVQEVGCPHVGQCHFFARVEAYAQCCVFFHSVPPFSVGVMLLMPWASGMMIDCNIAIFLT